MGRGLEKAPRYQSKKNNPINQAMPKYQFIRIKDIENERIDTKDQF